MISDCRMIENCAFTEINSILLLKKKLVDQPDKIDYIYDLFRLGRRCGNIAFNANSFFFFGNYLLKTFI